MRSFPIVSPFWGFIFAIDRPVILLRAIRSCNFHFNLSFAHVVVGGDFWCVMIIVLSERSMFTCERGASPGLNTRRIGLIGKIFNADSNWNSEGSNWGYFNRFQSSPSFSSNSWSIVVNEFAQVMEYGIALCLLSKRIGEQDSIYCFTDSFH